ncbi:MAG: alpha/beta fold hydrolase [Myxococcaceae bacterium]
MGFFSARGVQLHFRDAGAGVPLLLLHAFPLSGAMFAPQLQALSGQARFLVPDFRGFGQSAVGEGPSTMDGLAEDALLLLDHLGITSAVVGGVSMGGYAALALLRRDPGRVRGLLLADTQVGADDEAARAARETLAAEVLRAGMEVLVQRQLPRLLSASAPASLRAHLAELLRTTPPEGAAAALRGMALRPDSRDILARFGGPVRVAVGTEDVLTPPAKARELASLVPEATLVELPGAGHLANLEAPEAFNRALARFLQRFSDGP